MYTYQMAGSSVGRCGCVSSGGRWTRNSLVAAEGRGYNRWVYMLSQCLTQWNLQTNIDRNKEVYGCTRCFGGFGLHGQPGCMKMGDHKTVLNAVTSSSSEHEIHLSMEI